ncbi:hypothetical protein MUO56_02760, partial [Candidatus Bathyarchaeota archaeon]|nr:hypothetical protein [Candidatus Bathyarchaeota archaeon]
CKLPVSRIVSGLSVVKVLAMAKDAVKEIRAKTERVGRLFVFVFSVETSYTLHSCTVKQSPVLNAGFQTSRRTQSC